MFDGLYQSIICYFVTHLVFYTGIFANETGHNVNGSSQMGVYIAHPAIVVINLYILMNTYRWDGTMLGLTLFSILLIWFWTGVYTADVSAFQFYKAAPQVYGTLSFWVVLLLTVVICLLPRFFAKALQKIFLPRDIDIVREQVRQHKFDYLNDQDPSTLLIPKKPADMDGDHMAKSVSSSDATESTPPVKNRSLSNVNRKSHQARLEDDQTPIIEPPGTSHTQTTIRGPHSQQGSDDTMNSLQRGEPGRPSYDRARFSQQSYNERLQRSFGPPVKATPLDRSSKNLDSAGASGLEAPTPVWERPSRPSYERMRSSMDQLRPSFEQSSDMTHVAGLMKVQSSHSGGAWKATETHGGGTHEG